MTINHFKNIALIVAAGSGSRLNSATPKQYLTIAGQTLLERTLATFITHPQIDATAVVIGPEHLELYHRHINTHPHLLPPIIGGTSRQASARLGLEAIAKYQPSKVMIHCASRIFIAAKYLDLLLSSLDHYQASCLVERVKDTIRHIDGNSFKTIERNNLYTVQTPQAFDYSLILKLHQEFQHLDLTDDIALLEHAAMQKDVEFIEAADFNIKITTKQDYLLAQDIIENHEKRNI